MTTLIEGVNKSTLNTITTYPTIVITFILCSGDLFFKFLQYSLPFTTFSFLLVLHINIEQIIWLQTSNNRPTKHCIVNIALAPIYK